MSWVPYLAFFSNDSALLSRRRWVLVSQGVLSQRLVLPPHLNRKQLFVPRQTLVAGYYVFSLPSTCLHFASVPNFSIYQQIPFICCICIITMSASLGIVTKQISIVYDRVRALVKVQEKFWGLLFLSIWNFMMKHHKIITVTKALFYHINLCSEIIFPYPGAIFMC